MFRHWVVVCLWTRIWLRTHCYWDKGSNWCCAVCPFLPQGPLQICSGCLITGLDSASSVALRNHPLTDVVIQGHTVRLRDIPSKVFTLSGRHDNWQVHTWSLDQLGLAQGRTPKQCCCFLFRVEQWSLLGDLLTVAVRRGGGGGPYKMLLQCFRQGALSQKSHVLLVNSSSCLFLLLFFICSKKLL